MLDNFQKSVCEQALNHYGIGHQIDKSIEEMSELITELTRIDDERTTEAKVITEIADAAIMLQQMSIIFGEERVESEIQKKILRLQVRMATQLSERHNVHRKDGYVLPLIHDDI